MSTSALASEIVCVGVFKYQELSFDHENSFSSREGLHVDFANLKPLTVKLHILGFKVS